MKLHLATCALAAWSILSLAVLADSPAEPRSWITTGSRNEFFFKMVPADVRWVGGKSVTKREPFGVAYKVTNDGQFKELWRTKGWYTFEGYLSEDGRYFARMGPWASDQKKHTDLAIAFYDRGKLLKSYQVRELIKEPEHLEYSVSHYQWRPEVQSTPTGFRDDVFHLVLIDKTDYHFDYKTGKIVASGRDTGAMSRREIYDAERAEAGKKGQELFEASSFRKSYEEKFALSEIEAADGKISGVHFEEPEWRATLAPIKALAQPCTAHAVFPIKDGKTIEVTIDPKEVEEAMSGALAHPFVAKRFSEGGATGLRMRFTGDRLHWNTPELQKFVAQVTGTEPKVESLRDWAYLIIDAEEPSFTPVYFHTKTKELIYEDQTKWPYEPILLDAAGARR